MLTLLSADDLHFNVSGSIKDRTGSRWIFICRGSREGRDQSSFKMNQQDEYQDELENVINDDSFQQMIAKILYSWRHFFSYLLSYSSLTSISCFLLSDSIYWSKLTTNVLRVLFLSLSVSLDFYLENCNLQNSDSL